MSFAADWLALREPYDRRARNPAVLDAVLAAALDKNPLRIVDLACGTGSTLRALAPRLPHAQHWRLVDNNLSLLARASESTAPRGTSFTTTPLDINYDLEAALDGPVDLVTTSALLDLVSAPWLERLATEIAARAMPFYAALTYDGRVELAPAHPNDARVVQAVNKHQRSDKGFGPALGPDAATSAITRFGALGYSLTQGEADWRFTTADREIQIEIFSGWAAAARETDDLQLPDIVDWLTFRRDAVAGGRSSLLIGHVDFFAAPMTTR